MDVVGRLAGRVLGHSVGEYVAACLAGVFDLEDGIKLITARARLMQALPDAGGMTVVLAGERLVRSAIAARAFDVCVAALNGPENVVISGDRASLAVLTEDFRAKGVETRPLNVSQAFHSILIEPMLEAFGRVAEGSVFPSLRSTWSPTSPETWRDRR